MTQSTPRLALPSTMWRIASTVPDFLAPSFARSTPSTVNAAKFSTSTPRLYPRDRNPNRGVSALRRTGLREPVSVSKEPLPQPVLDPTKRSKVEVDVKHGLWGFFNKDRAPLATPEQDAAHGEQESWKVSLASEANNAVVRSSMDCGRTPKKVVGRSSLALVGMCKGKESHRHQLEGTGTGQGWIWRI